MLGDRTPTPCPPPPHSESGEDSVVIVEDDEDVQEILDDGDGKRPLPPKKPWGGPQILLTPPNPKKGVSDGAPPFLFQAVGWKKSWLSRPRTDGRTPRGTEDEFGGVQPPQKYRG